VESAPELTPLIQIARRVNDAQPAHVVELIKKVAGDLRGKNIAALGMAFKPDVDDLRESPAIAISRMLVDAGASVTAYEPYKPDADIPGLSTVSSLGASLEGSDILVLLVAHTPFKNLVPGDVSSHTNARLIMDTVNIFNPAIWEPAGFALHRLGVGISKF
jgi:UDP-N-acetyl-D-mannosaminuronate dehydrogenase